MRSLLTLVLIAFVASPLAGCRRNTGPSPEFVEAQGQYDRLRLELGDEAYSDPGMTEIEDLLKKVEPNSSDAADAKALLATIASERARIAEEAAATTAAPDAPVNEEPQFEELEDEPEEAVAAAAVDAGTPQPQQGMTVADFEARFSRCFETGPEIMVAGIGTRATYQLKDLIACRSQHPIFNGLVLLVDGGRIAGFAQQSALQLRLPDGGTPRESSGTPPAEAPPPEPQPETPAPPAQPTTDGIKY